MPTVSTVENTTSASFSGRRHASTVAKSPEWPPEARTIRSRTAPAARRRTGFATRLEVVPDRKARCGKLVEPVQAVRRPTGSSSASSRSAERR